MAAMIPTPERVPPPGPAPLDRRDEEPAGAVKIAPKAAVRAAIDRFAREHADLIKDLAK
jgi:hypothetical protein